MNVPFLDLRQGYLELKAEIDCAVMRVLASGTYIMGPEVESFEREYARFCGARHCVGVANGLEALTLSLLAMEVGPGDEVIVPSNTFIATWLAVTSTGAMPVPVEPAEATGTLDPGRVEEAITPRTKALLPVHLYGQPADLDPLLAIARSRGLLVLEDAAQAHGAAYKGHPIGAHGTIVAWSFYPGKNLGGMGDGGAVTTDDPRLAERVRILGNYGAKEKYLNAVPGRNSRLDPLQAAILRLKLGILPEWNARRKARAERYGNALKGQEMRLPEPLSGSDPSWHIYAIRHPDRDRLQRHLERAGIATLIHYPVPPHLQPAYRTLHHGAGSHPICERLALELLSLPMGPHLRDDQQDHVIDTLLAFRG